MTPIKLDKSIRRRSTDQRRLLLDLINKAEGHLDADELYLRAKQIKPQISLSTIYRTLKLLKDLDIIKERHFKEEHHHYEVNKASEHYHLVCLKCGRVIEFESAGIKQITEDMGRKKGFRVTVSELHVEGYCRGCRSYITGK